MFGRRRQRADHDSGAPSLGIGALVQVVNDGRGESWADEPIGVIVAPAGQIAGYPGVGVAVRWTVAFDVPAYTEDGRGPFEHAAVSAMQLVPLHVTPEGEPTDQ
jgi:hypothetical protein